jgi:hypothetical protein
LSADARANDLVFWTTQLVVHDLQRQADTLRANGANFVSKGGKSSQLVRDPDGHALQFIERSSSRGNEALTSKAKTE